MIKRRLELTEEDVRRIVREELDTYDDGGPARPFLIGWASSGESHRKAVATQAPFCSASPPDESVADYFKLESDCHGFGG